MSVQTQVYAKPRHQFMPSWVPRNQHGHHGHRGHHHNNSHGGYHGNRDHHGGGGKPLGGLHGTNAAISASALPAEFDGKRLRKAVARKTVDYNASLSDWIMSRVWQRDHRDAPAPQPDPSYQLRLPPPAGLTHSPVNAVTTKFVRAATNKMKCPVFCVTWTPEGRRLITGASSGEFTLWNGLTFNFETILQAHDLAVRCMTWSRGDQWMVTGDHGGYIKYWQSNMNNVRMFQGHKEAVRGISFCPTDAKFSSCSDDGTVRVWDFQRCFEERILRGHGSDVKCVDWHPQKALIVSGSKDSQQPVKLWCPKAGRSVATIHAHKSTVMDARWNRNGHWLLTASRDHLIKLFDVRKLNVEMQTFRGHKREACTLAWHPVHEDIFASGGSDGSVMFWAVGSDKELGGMEQAHESCVWSLAWHPVGHILCTGSNDHTSKFWTRNRPGDRMRDRYNLNTLPRGSNALAGEEDDDEGGGRAQAAPEPNIPGMGIDAEQLQRLKEGSIPGLDDDKPQKKTPHSKPIHKGFQQQWLENRAPVVFQQTGDESQPSDGQVPPNHPANSNNSVSSNNGHPNSHPVMGPPQQFGHPGMPHGVPPGAPPGWPEGGPPPGMNMQGYGPHPGHMHMPPPQGFMGPQQGQQQQQQQQQFPGVPPHPGPPGPGHQMGWIGQQGPPPQGQHQQHLHPDQGSWQGPPGPPGMHDGHWGPMSGGDGNGMGGEWMRGAHGHPVPPHPHAAQWGQPPGPAGGQMWPRERSRGGGPNQGVRGPPHNPMGGGAPQHGAGGHHWPGPNTGGGSWR
ncbi:pre-mRNA 3' end processing protein WDR33-like [Tropilaelaps mercedesae]|uniref:Pre-mRNA 3' end processing protein WDR33-like n=1 Tax=Tropilaelaps mercedesae TaxID=418985 RepID=A0A1V9XTG4_9ACAR|nr:pre-mRNA 3' end processing protein WDR33-like [Tropilaelaps mercedesae]